MSNMGEKTKSKKRESAPSKSAPVTNGIKSRKTRNSVQQTVVPVVKQITSRKRSSETDSESSNPTEPSVKNIQTNVSDDLRISKKVSSRKKTTATAREDIPSSSSNGTPMEWEDDQTAQLEIKDKKSSVAIKRVPSSRKKTIADKKPDNIQVTSGPLKRVPSSRGKKTEEVETNSSEDIVMDDVSDSNQNVQPDLGNDVNPKSSERRNTTVVTQHQGSSTSQTNKLTATTADDQKGISPRKRRASSAKEKRSEAVKSLPVDIQQPSTSRRNIAAQTAKRQKVPELSVSPLSTISGKVFVMGRNDVGQLGFSEDTEEKQLPFNLELPYSIVDIAAGGMHSVCLTSNGEVITFGCNDEGALGRITDDASPEYMPRRVNISERIVQISAADSHTAALSEAGQVYLWGNFRGGDGQMGLTTTGLKRIEPMRILENEKIVMISSGNEHLVCLSNNGKVFSCGAAEVGQLGRLSQRNAMKGGRAGLVSLVNPAQVYVSKSGKTVIMDKVWTEDYATFLRERGTGSIYACGLNNYYQLGIGSKEPIYLPKKVESFENNAWELIGGGMHHTIALDSAGKVYAIGRKEDGRLGLGDIDDHINTPTRVRALDEERCVDISCGPSTSFAVTEQGAAYAWGFGENYELGNGEDKDRIVPTLMSAEFLESWKALKVSGGGQHALILACKKE